MFVNKLEQAAQYVVEFIDLNPFKTVLSLNKAWSDLTGIPRFTSCRTSVEGLLPEQVFELKVLMCCSVGVCTNERNTSTHRFGQVFTALEKILPSDWRREYQNSQCLTESGKCRMTEFWEFFDRASIAFNIFFTAGFFWHFPVGISLRFSKKKCMQLYHY